MKQPATYILSNQRRGTLYVGVTSNLVRRIWMHRQNSLEGFSQRYGLHRLVYFERHETMVEAITREKQLKHWRRAWKIHLIEQYNPMWRDLWDDIIQ